MSASHRHRGSMMLASAHPRPPQRRGVAAGWPSGEGAAQSPSGWQACKPEPRTWTSLSHLTVTSEEQGTSDTVKADAAAESLQTKAPQWASGAPGV